MTIFEMLEKLETEIVSLRARCQSLASSQGASPGNGAGRAVSASPDLPVVPKKRKAKPSGKKTRKAAAARKAPVSRQLERPVSDAAAAEDQSGRALGKRQALGKSLVQLRKMSAWRTGRDAEG